MALSGLYKVIIKGRSRSFSPFANYDRIVNQIAERCKTHDRKRVRTELGAFL